MKKTMLVFVCLLMAYLSYADTIIKVSRNGVITTIRHTQDINCGDVEPGAGVTIVDCYHARTSAVVPNTAPTSFVKNEVLLKEGSKSTVLFKIRSTKATTAN